MNEQPLNKISVREITEETDTLIRKYPSISSLDECVSVAFQFALQNKKAVQHIYNSVNRDIYERYLMKICNHVVTAYLDTVSEKDAICESDRAILIRFFQCEIFGLSFEWITNGMKDDAIQEICRLTELCRGFFDELLSRCKESRDNPE